MDKLVEYFRKEYPDDSINLSNFCINKTNYEKLIDYIGDEHLDMVDTIMSLSSDNYEIQYDTIEIFMKRAIQNNYLKLAKFIIDTYDIDNIYQIYIIQLVIASKNDNIFRIYLNKYGIEFLNNSRMLPILTTNFLSPDTLKMLFVDYGMPIDNVYYFYIAKSCDDNYDNLITVLNIAQPEEKVIAIIIVELFNFVSLDPQILFSSPTPQTCIPFSKNKLDVLKILYGMMNDGDFARNISTLMIFIAISNDDLNLLNLILESGNYSRILLDYHLAQACKKESEVSMLIIKTLLDHGADINNSDTPSLLIAVCKEYPKLVRFLISNGADVTVNNNSAIMKAVANYNIEITKILLENGATIDNEMLKDLDLVLNPEFKKFLEENGVEIDFV